MKKKLCLLLVFVLIMGLFPLNAQAKAKPKMLTKDTTMGLYDKAVKIKIKNAQIKKCKFQISDKNIISIKNGCIYPKKEGTCTVTVKVNNYKFKFKVTILYTDKEKLMELAKHALDAFKIVSDFEDYQNGFSDFLPCDLRTAKKFLDDNLEILKKSTSIAESLSSEYSYIADAWKDVIEEYKIQSDNILKTDWFADEIETNYVSFKKLDSFCSTLTPILEKLL